MRRLGSANEKILALEYGKPVANVVGPAAVGVVDYYENVAARHSGRLNILYVDGRVESVLPEAIDPTNPVIHDQKWCPEIDSKLRMSSFF